MNRLDLRVAKLKNVRVYALEKVGKARVKDQVLIGSDEGCMILRRSTGKYCEMNADDLHVSELLFERAGRVAVITGIGQNPDGSGLSPGKSTIESGGKTYKVLFALEGLCIATIHSGKD